MEIGSGPKVGRFEDEGWRIRKDGSRFWAIVELHEGQILVEFPEEGGTRFVVGMPLGEDSSI